MSETVAIRESTIHSLQVIFAYQGQQLIKKIGKKMGWDDKEIKSLVSEFINKKTMEVSIISNDAVKRTRGGKKDLVYEDRCRAKISSGKQCSRHRRDGVKFCGIHLRKSKTDNGLEYGIVKKNRNPEKNNKECCDGNQEKNKYEIDTDIDEDNGLFILGEKSDSKTDEDVILSSSSNEADMSSDEEIDMPTSNKPDVENEEISVEVEGITIEGMNYMIDNDTNIVYSCNDDTEIGKYNNVTGKLILYD